MYLFGIQYLHYRPFMLDHFSSLLGALFTSAKCSIERRDFLAKVMAWLPFLHLEYYGILLHTYVPYCN